MVEIIEITIFEDENGKEPFTVWFNGLKDKMAKVKIRQRLDRAKMGNLGEVEPVGESVSELKIHYGPGYRIYFGNISKKKIIILHGGTKGTQKKDIKLAREYYKNI
jgi:putative addiction module killer protein